MAIEVLSTYKNITGQVDSNIMMSMKNKLTIHHYKHEPLCPATTEVEGMIAFRIQIIYLRNWARTGKYPYNPAEPEYLRKYPIGFRGCFKCGSTGHYRKEYCPMGPIKDGKLLDTFFKEFKIHKSNHEQRRSGFVS